MSTIDVVIPCYNYGRYLRSCVRSVLSQDVDLRVLVIDDASSDDTPLIASELAAGDGRVEFYRHEVNRGHISTYNEGLLGWSTSEYTVLLSADDMLTPGSLRRAVQIMDADKSIGLVYGRPFYFQDEVELPQINSARPYRCSRWAGAEWLEGRCRAGHNVISSPEVVMRGSIQRAVGGYRPDLPHVADFELWLRIAAASNIAYVRGVPQAFYRRHSATMTTCRTKLVDLRERGKAFDIFFEQHRHTIADADRLHGLAKRALAREALWAACRAYDRNRVNEARVEELIEFAVRICPEASSVPEYAALRRRRRLGPVICSRTQVFAAPALVRRFRKWLWWRRWERHGI